ncbi:hypothetical protein NL676_002663 [Syzygium grande]|nr:hypothetical protein NL676_002663 [Syzygium grande]
MRISNHALGSRRQFPASGPKPGEGKPVNPGSRVSPTTSPPRFVPHPPPHAHPFPPQKFRNPRIRFRPSFPRRGRSKNLPDERGSDMDGNDSEKQSTADMTAFVQNLLQQMQSRFQTMSESIITKNILSLHCI